MMSSLQGLNESARFKQLQDSHNHVGFRVEGLGLRG